MSRKDKPNVRRLISALMLTGLITTTPLAAKPPRQPAGATPSTDADQPLTSAQQAAIDRYVSAEMGRQRIPGLQLGIYLRGHPIYMKGYGFADLEWRVPITSDTRMQTGSIGKQFVAAAIMRLAEQGKVDLDASIRTYFPEAPASWQPISVAHLLSHTSGIGTYDTPERNAPGGMFDLRREFTEQELATAIVALPPDFAVGTEWRYNNTNYVLLGILIQRVTGQFHGDYLRDSFFAPLGMSATRVISDTEVIERRAQGYEIKGGVLGNQAWVSATFNSTGDGTIYTNVEDMARWDHALHGERILKRSSLQRMWTPFALANGKPNDGGYGFGWFTRTVAGHRIVEHGGAWQGFAADIARYVDDGLTVMVFTNLDAEHARPNNIGRVVAGLVAPALMPKLATPVVDDDPARVQRVRAFIAKAAAEEDLSADYDPAADYKADPLAARELVATLPVGWAAAPMTLIAKKGGHDGVRYDYRVGPAGDTRVFNVTIAPSGRLMEYWVLPDPDNR